MEKIPKLESFKSLDWEEMKASAEQRLKDSLGEEYMEKSSAEKLQFLQEKMSIAVDEEGNNARYFVEAVAKEASRQKAQVEFEKEMNRLDQAA